MENKAAIKLCTLEDLADGGSRGFCLGEFPDSLEVFVVRQGARVVAYRNRCPHTGAGLEWRTDRFLDAEGEYIQCHTHGALFRIEDGFCVSGPCGGQSLSRLPIRVENATVYLLGTAAPD